MRYFFTYGFRDFINNLYSEEKKVPMFVKVALELAGIKIELKYPFSEVDEKAKY